MRIGVLAALACLYACAPAAAEAYAPRMQEKEVESLNPLWLPAQLREKGVSAAVLSLCGANLHSCDDAKKLLRRLTQECSNVFLGIIDLDRYPGAPHNLYDAEDPRLILLAREPHSRSLGRVGVRATIRPQTVAMVLCPRESKSFGHVLRLLGQ